MSQFFFPVFLGNLLSDIELIVQPQSKIAISFIFQSS